MRYVNDGLVACRAGTEDLQEFYRLIPHRNIVSIVVKLLLHDSIEHVFRNVTRISDIDGHAADGTFIDSSDRGILREGIFATITRSRSLPPVCRLASTWPFAGAGTPELKLSEMAICATGYESPLSLRGYSE